MNLPLADQDREALAKLIIESATDYAIFTIDFEGCVTSWNSGAQRLLGYDGHEIVGEDVRRIFTLEDRVSGIIETEMREALAKGRADDERWHLRKDGSRFWASGLLMPLRAPGGDAHGFLKMLRDQTARHQAEEALRASQERLQLAIEGAGMATWDVDIVSKTDIWSPNRFEALGYVPVPSGAATIDMWRDRLHPDDADAAMKAYWHSISTGAPYAHEYRIIRADTGETRWMSAYGRCILDGHDRPCRFVGISFDVTDRKQAEADRDRFALVANNSADLIAITDLEGVLHYLNPAGLALIGRVPVDALGSRIADYFSPEDRTRIANTLMPALNAGGRWKGELSLCPQSSDAAVQIWSDWFLMHDRATGQPTHICVTGRDLSREKRAETELRRANDELALRIAERTNQVAAVRAEHTAAVDALRQAQKMEAVGQLAGGIAHDFNNLLTVIRSSIDLLNRPGMSEDKRARYIAAIAETTDRAASLTRHLLTFARKQPLQPQVFNLNDRIVGMTQMLDSMLGGRVRIETQLADDLWPIEADPNQFDVALLNLTVNARDAMTAGGTILIATRNSISGGEGNEGETVALSVADTGIGIPREDLQHIFEPFFTTKPEGKGTGLGLPQVHSFIKQSGGEIRVESEPGRGTTFTLYFPRARAATDQHPPVEHSPHHRSPADKPQGCVLVIEDNQEIGTFAGQLLEELGFATTWVTTAEQAIELIDDDWKRFDLVLADVVLPGAMSGIELARELRRRCPGMPVVLTTGYSQELADEGSDGFEVLQKPYSLEALSKLLRKVASSSDA